MYTTKSMAETPQLRRFINCLEQRKYTKAHQIYIDTDIAEIQEVYASHLTDHFNRPLSLSDAVTAASIFISIEDYQQAADILYNIHMEYPRSPDVAYYNAKLYVDLAYSQGDYDNNITLSIRHFTRCIKLIVRGEIYNTDEYKSMLQKSVVYLYGYIKYEFGDSEFASKLAKRYRVDQGKIDECNEIMRKKIEEGRFEINPLINVTPVAYEGVKSLLRI